MFNKYFRVDMEMVGEYMYQSFWKKIYIGLYYLKMIEQDIKNKMQDIIIGLGF